MTNGTLRSFNRWQISELSLSPSEWSTMAAEIECAARDKGSRQSSGDHNRRSGIFESLLNIEGNEISSSMTRMTRPVSGFSMG